MFINTKVIFKWDKEKKEYIEVCSEGYEYEGVVALAGGTTVEAPQPTAQELELQQIQLDALKQQQAESEILKPYLLQSLGLVNEGGGYRRMTEEEMVGSMTSTERANYDILKLQQERQLQALRGELPVSPALEADIAEQEKVQKELLSRKLGKDWAATTPGIQSISAFDTKAELLREASRRDELTSGQSAMLSQQGFMTGLNQTQQQGYTGYGQRLFPLVGAAGQAQQPYQFNRSMQLNADIANAQSSANALGGLGSLVGSVAGGVGTYFGLAALAASDIRLKTDIELIDSIDNINIYSFSYLPDKGLPEGRQIGVMAQEIREDLPSAVIFDKDGYYAVMYNKLPSQVLNRIQTLRGDI